MSALCIVRPPIEPMLCARTTELPDGPDWWFEPKWDGYRCIVFRDGDDVLLQSRNGKPLNRWFPEVVEAMRRRLPPGTVVDGELVVVDPTSRGLSFSQLASRIHPAASRVEKLSVSIPASFVAFDAIEFGGVDLRDKPFVERRRVLVEDIQSIRPLYLSPSINDRAVAQDWYDMLEGAGLDGVVARPSAVAYKSGERALTKVVHRRTADVVVLAVRDDARGGVGSMLVGIRSTEGFRAVGATSSFAAALRAQLQGHFEGLRTGEDLDDEVQSRWSNKSDQPWHSVKPNTVVEVSYDQYRDFAFRHIAKFVRFRPDRDADSCLGDDLVVVPAAGLDDVLSLGAGAA